MLVQGLLATALLGPDAIGLYGIVTTTAMTIVALRRVGIDEAFVQQRDSDEEAEFQRALHGRAGARLVAALAIAALRAGAGRPLRRRPAAPAHARPSPTCRWPSRCRRRSGSSSAGWTTCGCACCRRSCRSARWRSRCRCCSPASGVWALVIGPACGNAAGRARRAARRRRTALRLRPDRDATRRYLRFSWPIFVSALAALLVAQGQIARVRARPRASPRPAGSRWRRRSPATSTAPTRSSPRRSIRRSCASATGSRCSRRRS